MFHWQKGFLQKRTLKSRPMLHGPLKSPGIACRAQSPDNPLSQKGSAYLSLKIIEQFFDRFPRTSIFRCDRLWEKNGPAVMVEKAGPGVCVSLR